MPNYRKRLLYLKALVLLSVAGSLASTFTMRQGWGEIYPFFNWKLYTQPRGSNHVYSVFRVYTRSPGAAEFIRQPVKATPTYDQDDYVYQLYNLAISAQTDSTHQSLEKLQAFVKHVHPNAEAYKVVQETMQVKNLPQHPEQYETRLVAQF